MKLISLIIPLYNEEKSLPRLFRLIKKNIPKDYNYEIIFIDDGSTDNSLRIISDLAETNQQIKVISFRKNFGKSAAYTAGFAASRGDIIITMDSDLQDNPTEIPAFINKIKEGNDLVVGWKKKRYDPISKTLPSKIFNRIVASSTKLKIHDIDCGFRAMKRSVAKDLNIHGNLYRFIPVFANQKGYKIDEIVVRHRPRKFGKSKFGTGRLIGGLFDFFSIIFINKYLEKPMHFFGLWGLIIDLIGIVICGYLTYLKLFQGAALSNRPLLFLGLILIIVGVQFFSLGLLGEFMLSRDKSKPNYSIKKKLNL